MKDIQDKQDIKLLVDTFYQSVTSDDLIGLFFNDVLVINWDKHMPVMYSFWESILLDSVNYQGNPMLKHLELIKKHPITSKHLDRWLLLWNTTIKNLFEGPIANQAMARAQQIGNLMIYKIEQSKSDSFIL